MKNFLILAFMFFTLSNIAYAETNSSTWTTTFGDLTIMQDSSQATGMYRIGAEITGTFENTEEGLILKGYWKEPGVISSFPFICGPENDWAGPFTFLFAPDGKSFTGDWGSCDESLEDMHVIDNTWFGTLTSGEISMLIPTNSSLRDRLDGVWEGSGKQSSSSTVQTWTIRFTAHDGIYQIEYPSLSCSGTWTFLSETSGSVTFFEDIKIGTNNCIDEGSVELLRIESNKLRYIYYLPNGNIDAFGELACSSCNINEHDSDEQHAEFEHGILHIPNVDVQDAFGEIVTYEVDLSLLPFTDPLAFELIKVNRK